MITKVDIEDTLKKAGVEVFDEAPGAPGGWFYTIGDMESGRFDGKLDAILTGLQCAEELERLGKYFNK
jgi:hypothetical protein